MIFLVMLIWFILITSLQSIVHSLDFSWCKFALLQVCLKFFKWFFTSFRMKFNMLGILMKTHILRLCMVFEEKSSKCSLLSTMPSSSTHNLYPRATNYFPFLIQMHFLIYKYFHVSFPLPEINFSNIFIWVL